MLWFPTDECSSMTTSYPIDSEFRCPANLFGVFAIVRLWPDAKAAEHEVIERIKIAAALIGLRCIEITEDGEIVGSPNERISSSNCDFVVHLHFATPKLYNVFSFVALWNPEKFYEDWGYQKYSRFLLTHDDFLSCGSRSADDMVLRLTSGRHRHLPPKYHLYPSLAEPILRPYTDKFSLFYVGINWERLSGRPERHQDLLKALDDTGVLRIYGPEIHQGMKVWEEYSSYMGEVPFDGVSLIREIASCGAALVLSSAAHRQSGMLSSRIFEALSAGALVITDENEFTRVHFGSNVLYVDTELHTDLQKEQVLGHLRWANSHPVEARGLATASQEIYLSKFRMDRQLAEIYTNFEDRKAQLNLHRLPHHYWQPNVRMFCLWEGVTPNDVPRRIGELRLQDYPKLRITAVVSSEEDGLREEILKHCKEQQLEVDFLVYDPTKMDAGSGSILLFCIQQLGGEDYFLFQAANELFQTSHVSSLVGSAIRNPNRSVLACSALIRNSRDGRDVEYSRNIAFSNIDSVNKIGLGRFLLSRALLRSHLASILPYLRHLRMAAFLSNESLGVEDFSTVILQSRQSSKIPEPEIKLEQRILYDFSPWLLRRTDTSKSAELRDLSGSIGMSPLLMNLVELNDRQKVELLGDLLKAALPTPVAKFVFALYSWLDRWSSRK